MSGIATVSQPAQAPTRPTAAKILWVSRTLDIMFAGSIPPPPPLPGKPMTYAGIKKSRQAWESMRKSVQEHLDALTPAIEKSVKAHNADKAAKEKFDPNEIGAGMQKLDTILERLDERLLGKLDAALNAQGAERTKLQRDILGLVNEYRGFAQKSEILATIDKNGFVLTRIKWFVDDALSVLAENF